jgi:hypothetical protein
MKQENTDQIEPRSDSSEGTATRPESGYDLTVRQVSKADTVQQSSAYGWPEPVVLVIRDLLDVPRQVLPEQTYVHLKNAGKEALLAVVSLVNSFSAKSSGDGKTRRRIDVE